MAALQHRAAPCTLFMSCFGIWMGASSDAFDPAYARVSFMQVYAPGVQRGSVLGADLFRTVATFSTGYFPVRVSKLVEMRLRYSGTNNSHFVMD